MSRRTHACIREEDRVVCVQMHSMTRRVGVREGQNPHGEHETRVCVCAEKGGGAAAGGQTRARAELKGRRRRRLAPGPHRAPPPTKNSRPQLIVCLSLLSCTTPYLSLLDQLYSSTCLLTQHSACEPIRLENAGYSVPPLAPSPPRPLRI